MTDHRCERLLIQGAFRLEIEAFLLAQFDQAGLGHNTFSEDALALLVRSSEGILRRARNLCVSALIEAVRDQSRTVELTQINRVLTQPHPASPCGLRRGRLEEEP